MIAAAPGVVGQYSAALVATGKSPALISVRPDGTTAGIINVVYGASFPTPAAGKLPCDAAGHCYVTGRQADGKPWVSAFELESDGAWRDVSGSNGFPSMTSRSGLVAVGRGDLGIAIQESAGSRSAWMVLAWSGERYEAIGCAPDAAAPPPMSALSLGACLS